METVREVMEPAVLAFIILCTAVLITLVFAKLLAAAHRVTNRLLYRQKVKWLMRLGYTPIEAVCIASQPYTDK